MSRCVSVSPGAAPSEQVLGGPTTVVLEVLDPFLEPDVSAGDRVTIVPFSGTVRAATLVAVRSGAGLELRRLDGTDDDARGAPDPGDLVGVVAAVHRGPVHGEATAPRSRRSLLARLRSR